MRPGVPQEGGRTTGTCHRKPHVVTNPQGKFRRQPAKNGTTCAIIVDDPLRRGIVVTRKGYGGMPLSLQQIDVQRLFASIMMTIKRWRALSSCIGQCTLALPGHMMLYIWPGKPSNSPSGAESATMVLRARFPLSSILDGLHRARGGKSSVLADDRPGAKTVAGASAQGSEPGSRRLKRQRARSRQA